MKLEDIQNEWKNDSSIDESELSKESLRIYKLHSKYYTYLIEEKKKKIIYESLLIQTKKHLWLKYKCYISKKDLHENEELFQLELSKKDDINIFIESDEKFIETKNNLKTIELKIEFLDSILKQIANLSFTIKNSIEFIKISQGII